MNKFKNDHPEYANAFPCESEFIFGEMNYVIDGIDYPIPSHHWIQRILDPEVKEGGMCALNIGPMDL